MSKESKMITSSVNLPITGINTLVNVDDRRFEVPIDEIINGFNDKTVEFIKTMNTTVFVDEKNESPKYVRPEYIEITNDVSYINNVEKREMNDENHEFSKKNLKFYRLKLTFEDGRTSDLIVPSYVKFYSSHKGAFIAVEKLVNRDILYSYDGKMIKTEDAELVKDYEMPKEYYNIKVMFERQHDEEDDVKEYPNLYINGILVNVAYNNFNKTFNQE